MTEKPSRDSLPPTLSQANPAARSEAAASETLQQSVTAGYGPLPTGTQTVSGYEIIGELGRGGMGVVYKAKQIGLNRVVALKVILAGAHAGDAHRTRFRAEAEAIARLRHPNIVQIFDIGEHNGLPYFSLEYCDGGSLANQLKGKPVPPAKAAALVETLARAIEAAHRAGIVHRDLKPANILLQESGDRNQGTGISKSKTYALTPDSCFLTPKISDFGLAKKLDEIGLTATGDVMGTPSYMAPEQARGETKNVGPAADIYALGTLLYELLTGRPPFKSATTFETIQRVVHEEPAPPSQAAPELPRDLEIICLKCLQKQPERRYATAAELADDLERFLTGESIRARRAGLLERGWRRIRRHAKRVGVTTAIVALLAIVLFLGFRGKPGDSAASAPTSSGEDEVLKVIAELNRGDPGWRLEDIERMRKVPPPERNSALVIQRAREQLPKSMPELALLDELARVPPNRMMNNSQLIQLRALLQGKEAALAEALRLVDLPEGHHELQLTHAGITTLLPHAQASRQVATLLTAEALRRNHEGQPDDALRACQAILNTGRSLADEPVLLSQLVRSACVFIAIRSAERTLGTGEPTDAALAALQSGIERETNAPLSLIGARGERGMLHWVMAAVTAGDLTMDELAQTNPDSEFMAALRTMPSGIGIRQAHAFLLRHLTRWVEIARLPDQEQLNRLQDWDHIVRTAPNGARQMLPSAVKVTAACVRHHAVARTAVAALATERFRLKHGAWPDKLAQLVPEFLAEVPADPYDGQPLRYGRNAQGGRVVYSVGPDRRDDGGIIDDADLGRDGTDIGFRLWEVKVRRQVSR